MENVESELSNSSFDKLEESLRSRARMYERSARYDMIVIIVTLFSCIIIFAGSEKLSDWMFKTPSERQADIELANAEAEIYRSIASLGVPISHLIRSLPSQLKPYIEKFISEYSEGKNGINSNQFNYNPPSDNQNAFPKAFPAIGPPGTETTNSAGQKKGPNMATSSEKVIEPQKKQLIELYKEYHNLHLSLISERERNWRIEDSIILERIKNDAQVKIAEINAESQTDASLAQSGKYNRILSLASEALTKIGSVVMVIWLVRIFIKKRQRAVKLSTFYLSLADAVFLISNNNHLELKEMVPLFTPLDSEEDMADTPIDQLIKALSLIKSNT